MEDGGMQVIAVPADSANGLKEGDVIQSVNGDPTPNTRAFRNAVRETPGGEAVTFGIVRNQNALTIKSE